MRSHMIRDDAPSENDEAKKIFSNEIKGIYKRVTGDVGIDAKLLEKSINLENSMLITTTLGLKEISDRMEKSLQEKRGIISSDKVMKKIVTDLYNVTRSLEHVMRNHYFGWFEHNIHSIMVDTMNDDSMKSVILDIALSQQMHDPAILRRMLSNSLTMEDIINMAEKSKVKMDTKNERRNLLEDVLEKTVNQSLEDDNNDISFGTNPAMFRENLVNLNITSDEQFKNLMETRKIKFPSNFALPTQDAFQYVLRILDIARKHVIEFLKQNPIYDVSEAFYDVMAPNQNILLNVKKNKSPINIVVRPSVGNKIIIHNEREVKELENPNNELWCSDGSNALQMTMGMIFRSNEFRVIKI